MHFHVFLVFATQNEATESAPWIPGRAADPPKSSFGAAIVPSTFFIDSAPFGDRFGDDFEDCSARCSVVFYNKNNKCLYTCAVAELRLAALNIYVYVYLHILNECIYVFI